MPGRLDGTEWELKLPLPAGRGKVTNTRIKGEDLQVRTKKRVQSGTEVRIRLKNLERSGWNEQMIVNRNVDRFRGGHQYPLLLHILRVCVELGEGIGSKQLGKRFCFTIYLLSSEPGCEAPRGCHTL